MLYVIKFRDRSSLRYIALSFVFSCAVVVAAAAVVLKRADFRR